MFTYYHMWYAIFYMSWCRRSKEKVFRKFFFLFSGWSHLIRVFVFPQFTCFSLTLQFFLFFLYFLVFSCFYLLISFTHPSHPPYAHHRSLPHPPRTCNPSWGICEGYMRGMRDVWGYGRGMWWTCTLSWFFMFFHVFSCFFLVFSCVYLHTPITRHAHPSYTHHMPLTSITYMWHPSWGIYEGYMRGMRDIWWVCQLSWVFDLKKTTKNNTKHTKNKCFFMQKIEKIKIWHQTVLGSSQNIAKRIPDPIWGI